MTFYRFISIILLIIYAVCFWLIHKFFGKNIESRLPSILTATAAEMFLTIIFLGVIMGSNILGESILQETIPLPKGGSCINAFALMLFFPGIYYIWRISFYKEDNASDETCSKEEDADNDSEPQGEMTKEEFVEQVISIQSGHPNSKGNSFWNAVIQTVTSPGFGFIVITLIMIVVAFNFVYSPLD